MNPNAAKVFGMERGPAKAVTEFLRHEVNPLGFHRHPIVIPHSPPLRLCVFVLMVQAAGPAFTGIQNPVSMSKHATWNDRTWKDGRQHGAPVDARRTSMRCVR